MRDVLGGAVCSRNSAVASVATRSAAFTVPLNNRTAAGVQIEEPMEISNTLTVGTFRRSATLELAAIRVLFGKKQRP